MRCSKEEFEKEVLFKENVKLFGVLQKVDPVFFTRIIKAFKGKDDLSGLSMYEEDGNLRVVHKRNSSDVLFKTTEILFRDGVIKRGHIIDVQPKTFLQDCFRGNLVEYRGILIPDSEKYRFQVNIMKKIDEKGGIRL